jgi:hypothetical protein
VSVSLLVWEGARPAGDSAALAQYVELSRRYLEGPPTPPTDRIAVYVSALVGKYPDLSDDDEAIVPWGSGPLIANASGPILHIDLKLNSVFEEGWRYAVETAQSHGLIAFDPQQGSLAEADPTAEPAPAAPIDPGRDSRVYRWLSLRSWRWPVLRPLLPLVRSVARRARRP